MDGWNLVWKKVGTTPLGANPFRSVIFVFSRSERSVKREKEVEKGGKKDKKRGK